MEDKDEKETLPPPPPIIDQLKEYVETYIKLARYRAIKRGTSLVAGIVIDILVVLGLSLTFLFASFALAFFFSELLSSYWQGFGCVTLIYLMAITALLVFKHKLERPMMDFLVRKIFK